MAHSSIFRFLRLIILKTFSARKFKNPISISFDCNRVSICTLDPVTALITSHQFFYYEFDNTLDAILKDTDSLKEILQTYKKHSLCCNLAISINDVLLKIIRIKQDPINSLYNRVYHELCLSLMTDDIMFDYVITAEAMADFVLQAVIAKKTHLARYYLFAQQVGLSVSKITIDTHSITSMLLKMQNKDQRLLIEHDNILFLMANPSHLSVISIINGKYQSYQELSITNDIYENTAVLIDNVKSYGVGILDYDNNEKSQIIIADSLANEQHYINYVANVLSLKYSTFGFLYKQIYAEEISIEDLNLLYRSIALSDSMNATI
jgi:hypothetical protein